MISVTLEAAPVHYGLVARLLDLVWSQTMSVEVHWRYVQGGTEKWRYVGKRKRTGVGVGCMPLSKRNKRLLAWLHYSYEVSHRWKQADLTGVIHPSQPSNQKRDPSGNNHKPPKQDRSRTGDKKEN